MKPHGLSIVTGQGKSTKQWLNSRHHRSCCDAISKVKTKTYETYEYGLQQLAILTEMPTAVEIRSSGTTAK